MISVFSSWRQDLVEPCEAMGWWPDAEPASLVLGNVCCVPISATACVPLSALSANNKPKVAH